MFKTKRFHLLLVIILFCLLLLSACDPSPEELEATSAAETAAAATSTPTLTPTPLPTPTSTPVPYDLSVLITGVEEQPVVAANVRLAEIKKGSSQISDDVGQVYWNDLPGETVNLAVSAQGYYPQDVSESITRGVNQLTIKLERDPHGVLPNEACGPSEKLLYLEDFQDGEADKWEEIKLRTQGWNIIPLSDSQGNTVLMNDGEQWAFTKLPFPQFKAAIWRIKFMADGKRINNFAWRFKEDYAEEEGHVEFSAYNAMFEPSSLAIFRSKWPISNPILYNDNPYVSISEWHLLEMSTFEGRLEVWLDGKRLLVYEDPEPLPEGVIEIGHEESPGIESITYYDNIIVCELSAPFVPRPTPEP